MKRSIVSVLGAGGLVLVVAIGTVLGHAWWQVLTLPNLDDARREAAAAQAEADRVLSELAARKARDQDAADQALAQSETEFQASRDRLMAKIAALGSGESAAEEEVLYEVLEVTDGDTLTIVDAGGIRTRVRLRRIDAPEMDEPGGPEAKAALEERLLGRRVKVTPYARDRYGRLVATVELP